VNNKDYEIDTIARFDREVKRFVKKKKFFALNDQLDELVEKAEKGEFEGKITKRGENPVPHNIYKLRLPNPDANAGKSDGYRVIYMVVTEKKIVVFLVIYYKKETETVDDSYIDGLISGYLMGLSEDNDDDESYTE
jgi:mRNA-degrading endonuclease RelE of RelBE toxin-antitoxin system